MILRGLLFSLALTAASAASAATESSTKTADAKVATQRPFAPNFKASIDSLYFDFQGVQNARDNIYGFENVVAQYQMLTLSYLASPTLDISVIGNYTRNYAETNFLGVLYKDETEGFNDTEVRATKTFFSGTDLWITSLAASLPTGSTSEKNVNAPAFNYPYNMQLGSGTFDFIGTVTFITTPAPHQWGVNGTTRVRTGRNINDYRKGNEYTAKVWYTYLLNNYLFPGVWFNYQHRQSIIGEDKTFGRNIFVEYYHAPRDFWDLTANITAKYAPTSRLQLRALVAKPLWQELRNRDDVQVFTDWFAQVGLEGQF